jgi:hypothetical protein
MGIFPLPFPFFPFPSPSPLVPQLITQCRNLRRLTLDMFTLDEDTIHVLDTAGRTDLLIELHSCDFTDAGAEALLDSLRRNSGPTGLAQCSSIHPRSLAGALRGNHSLKILNLSPDETAPEEYSEEEMHELVVAVKWNQGLVQLNLQERFINDKNWSILCKSLARHPTLEVLNFYFTACGGSEDFKCVLTDVQKTSRMESLLEMLQVNTMLHTIELRPDERDTQIWKQAILPRLANTPQFRSVHQARDLWRSKLLVRALHSVNDDPTLLWMFLSSDIKSAFAGRMPKQTRKRKKHESSTNSE